MKLYYLRSVARSAGNLVDIADRQHRFAGYFMWNDNDGKFLEYSTPKGIAQAFLTQAEIERCDYLDCSMSIPIFSGAARDVLAQEIPDEIKFHEIEIEAAGTKNRFFLGKCLKYAAIVDNEASTYRDLTDGTPVLSRSVLKSRFEEDFHLARDAVASQILVASQRFVDLCAEHRLRVGFLDTVQT